MSRALILLTIFLIAGTGTALGQELHDTDAITGTALDYIEGWYEADVKRMDRALHPKLAKRKVFVDSESDASELRDLSKEQMLEYTGAGGGSDTRAEDRDIEVTILDVLEDTASVKITSVSFTDYLHLVRWNGDWVVINVVWENKGPAH